LPFDQAHPDGISGSTYTLEPMWVWCSRGLAISKSVGIGGSLGSTVRYLTDGVHYRLVIDDVGGEAHDVMKQLGFRRVLDAEHTMQGTNELTPHIGESFTRLAPGLTGDQPVLEVRVR